MKKKKKKRKIDRNEIRARVTKIEVHPRGSECEDNRGLDPPSVTAVRHVTGLRDRHANSGSRLEHVTIDLA